MVSHSDQPTEAMRVLFRGSSKLDVAIRQARPMARRFLLRRLAEEGWRIRQLGSTLTVDPSDWAMGVSDDTVVSVLFHLDDQSELTGHLRSLQREGRVAQMHRIETLRALAALGLAAQGQFVEGSIGAQIDRHQLGSVGTGGLVGASLDPGAAHDNDMSHLPFGRFADEVSLA